MLPLGIKGGAKVEAANLRPALGPSRRVTCSDSSSFSLPLVQPGHAVTAPRSKRSTHRLWLQDRSVPLSVTPYRASPWDKGRGQGGGSQPSPRAWSEPGGHLLGQFSFSLPLVQPGHAVTAPRSKRSTHRLWLQDRSVAAPALWSEPRVTCWDHRSRSHSLWLQDRSVPLSVTPYRASPWDKGRGQGGGSQPSPRAWSEPEGHLLGQFTQTVFVK